MIVGHKQKRGGIPIAARGKIIRVGIGIVAFVYPIHVFRVRRQIIDCHPADIAFFKNLAIDEFRFFKRITFSGDFGNGRKFRIFCFGVFDAGTRVFRHVIDINHRRGILGRRCYNVFNIEFVQIKERFIRFQLVFIQVYDIVKVVDIDRLLGFDRCRGNELILVFGTGNKR